MTRGSENCDEVVCKISRKMTSNLHANLRINRQSRQFAEVKQSKDTDIICSSTVTPWTFITK